MKSPMAYAAFFAAYAIVAALTVLTYPGANPGTVAQERNATSAAHFEPTDEVSGRGVR